MNELFHTTIRIPEEGCHPISGRTAFVTSTASYDPSRGIFYQKITSYVSYPGVQTEWYNKEFVEKIEDGYDACKRAILNTENVLELMEARIQPEPSILPKEEFNPIDTNVSC